MPKHKFIVSVRYAEGDKNLEGFHTIEHEHEFDPDDIYDGALGAAIRGLARMSMVEAGVRQSSDLGVTE